MNEAQIKLALENAYHQAKKEMQGESASYIPELASVPKDFMSVCVNMINGQSHAFGDEVKRKYTLQSVSKLVVLIGLLEEVGHKIFERVLVEPSGTDFASVARLDQFGPLPSNPMLNAGAIALCDLIPGPSESRFSWIRNWCKLLFDSELAPNMSVFASERNYGDRNRSLAFLLKSTGVLTQNVDTILESYFYLCSCEATIEEVCHLPYLLANGGKNKEGKQLLSQETVRITLSIMATSGLYNESGQFLVECGMPAKSAVSGFIVATSPGRGGIAALNPRVNRKGNSPGAWAMIRELSRTFGWHFADGQS